MEARLRRQLNKLSSKDLEYQRYLRDNKSLLLKLGNKDNNKDNKDVEEEDPEEEVNDGDTGGVGDAGNRAGGRCQPPLILGGGCRSPDSWVWTDHPHI